MRSFFLYAATLLLFVLLNSCREDGVVTTTVTGDVPPPAIVTGTINVITQDRGGNTLSDASISGVSASSSTINPDGSVTISTASLDPNGTAVQVTKPGFWPENRVLKPSAGGELREVFVMEPKVKAGEINPNDGGTITLGDNFSVSIPAGAQVTTADGEAYDGPVEVYVNHDAPEDFEEMVNSASNFLARNADGSMSALESYGMMDIALEAPDGTPLELGADSPAEVKMPLKAATQAMAPDEVKFWVLDPDGFWLEDGVARLAPGCYVVYIRSSATCNVDVPHPVTEICGRFVDPNGLPLTHAPFLVSLDGGMSCSGARVDCDGYFCVDVAADVPLLFRVVDPCTEEITVFAVDPVDPQTSRDIGELVVDLTAPVFMATVRDCDGMSLPNIEATEIWAGGNGGNDGEYFAPSGEGSTVINVIDCSGDDLVLQAFTNDYRAASRVIRKDSEDDAPEEFIVCGDLGENEYFNLIVGGTEVAITELAPIYWPGSGEGRYDWLVRAAGELNGEIYSVFLQFAAPREGRFPDDAAAAAVYRLLPGQDYGEGRVYVNPNSDLGLQGASFDGEAGVFEGTFSTEMNLQNDATQTVEAANVEVTATFRLEL